MLFENFVHFPYDIICFLLICYLQVNWAGFDKLEGEGGITRQVLLLGYRSGFQVWDVEEADNVRDLVSRHGGPVSFMQMLPKPIATKRSEDKFADSRPLLVLCADGNLSVGNNMQDGIPHPHNATIPNGHDSMNGGFVPTAVFFYSLRSQSFVYNIKFRSVVYSVRCSPRVVAISLATQVCFCIFIFIVVSVMLSGWAPSYNPFTCTADTLC